MDVLHENASKTLVLMLWQSAYDVDINVGTMLLHAHESESHGCKNNSLVIISSTGAGSSEEASIMCAGRMSGYLAKSSLAPVNLGSKLYRCDCLWKLGAGDQAQVTQESWEP